MTDNRTSDETGRASRRALVGGVIGLGVGVPLIAACGSDDSSDGASDSGGTTSSGPIGKTADVPVGGAKIYTAEKVMVSQPSAGEFKAFSTVCTHRQCTITKLDGDEIECSCHLSRYSIADGSVTKDPATEPLQELKVTVQGDDLSVT